MTLSSLLFLSCLLCCSFRRVLCLQEPNGVSLRDFRSDQPGNGPPTINVVSLTQRGYIQFLRYIVDVPPLLEFTFCIWVRNTNFTYSQPLFSYSRHDEERLVRAWISPRGEYINLEILEVPVFSFPVNLRLNHWNHICQSWSAYQGEWALFINGKLAIHGIEPKLSGSAITGDGDIVVGQEYTDVDKGYEDGIEGDVFGFNLVQAFTSGTTFIQSDLTNSVPFAKRRRNVPLQPPRFSPSPPNVRVKRQKRGILNIFRNMLSFFMPPHTVRLKSVVHIKAEEDHRVQVQRPPVVQPTEIIPEGRILSEAGKKPFGLLLVELGYNCLQGRGAPLQGDKVIVSWTKTTVRVFGGAMLRPEVPFCIAK